MATFKLEFETAGLVKGQLVRTDQDSQPGTLASIDLNDNENSASID